MSTDVSATPNSIQKSNKSISGHIDVLHPPLCQSISLTVIFSDFGDWSPSGGSTQGVKPTKLNCSGPAAPGSMTDKISVFFYGLWSGRVHKRPNPLTKSCSSVRISEDWQITLQEIKLSSLSKKSSQLKYWNTTYMQWKTLTSHVIMTCPPSPQTMVACQEGHQVKIKS